MKRLIVNADDYNTDPERNRGILEAARRGIVTSVSVIVNLGWPEGAQDELRSVFGPRTGVHLNLTNGPPVSRSCPSLVGPDGNFFPRAGAWRRALGQGFEHGQVEREFAAQMEAMQAAGFAPDHFDGNNHLHIFPGTVKAAASAAAGFGLRRVRLPREPLLWSARLPGPAVVKKCFLTLLSLRARFVFLRAGLVFPDRAAGIHVPDAGSAAAIEAFLGRLPEGTTELLCHPGYRSPSGGFSSPARERELSSLTAASVAESVKRNTIELISFSELPCA